MGARCQGLKLANWTDDLCWNSNTNKRRTSREWSNTDGSKQGELWIRYKWVIQGGKEGGREGGWDRDGDSVRLAFHKQVHVATSCRASRGLSWWRWLAVEAGRVLHGIPVASDVAQGMMGKQVSCRWVSVIKPGFTQPKRDAPSQKK